MGIEAIALSATQITAVVAMGLFLWHVFGRRFDAVDARFDGVDARFDRVDSRIDRFEADVDARFDRFATSVDVRFSSLEAKVDDLAKDHQSLARELSEFRGEVRGRLDAVLPTAPPTP